MKRVALIVAATLVAGAAGADVPLFAAKCAAGLNVDTNAAGQVYINGKLAKVISRPDGQVSANSEGVWVDITPQGYQPPRVTYTARDKSVGECEILSFRASDDVVGAHPSVSPDDAKVPGTKFHATASVPCSMGGGASTQCPAGVERQGGGSAMVTVTKPDGRTRTIFFERGWATGYDRRQADTGEFSASKKGDLNIIRIGEERYEIPDALPFGG